MRIALVAPLVTAISEPFAGGSQAFVADLAAGLTDRGHEVDVFAASGSDIPGARVVDTGVDPSALQDTLFRPGRGPGRVTQASREAFRRSWSLVARGSYEIVHNHAFDVAAIEEASAVDVPVVHTMHLPPAEPMVAALRAAPSSVVAVVSASQAKAWSMHVRVHAVLRNGVNVRAIPWSDQMGDFALFAGRLSPEKGASDAVSIARAADVRIVVVGDTYDASYARRIREICSDVQPPLPRPQLWELMATASAVLCPVRWDEPFGLVAAEAQAAGTPVIGYARGGLTEVVRDGVTGRLVEPDDMAAAAEALRSAASFDRAACRSHAEQDLDLEAVFDAHEALYETVLSRSEVR